MLAHAASSDNPTPGASAARPAANLRKIPIGVFDPVYEPSLARRMLDKVTALGLEAMEIGTGGYPNNLIVPRRPCE